MNRYKNASLNSLRVLMANSFKEIRSMNADSILVPMNSSQDPVVHYRLLHPLPPPQTVDLLPQCLPVDRFLQIPVTLNLDLNNKMKTLSTNVKEMSLYAQEVSSYIEMLATYVDSMDVLWKLTAQLT